MINPNSLFMPTRAIRDDGERYFAGRKQLFTTALEKIELSGSSLLIYGERGVGKTSVAWQLLKTLANENDPLLKRMGMENHIKERRATCIWTEVAGVSEGDDADVKNRVHLKDVITGLLRYTRASYSLSAHFPKLYDEQVIKSFERSHGVDLYNPDLEDLNWASCISLLKEVVLEISKLYPEADVLIFMDEVDRVIEKNQIAELIKTVGNARFVMVPR